jgi:hypothetical protein
MRSSKNRGLAALSIAVLACSPLASEAAFARNKTGWIKCCDPAGKSYEVPEGTPGAIRAPEASGGVGGGPRAAARNKTGWIIYTVAGLAAVGGIIAATSGSSPASP